MRYVAPADQVLKPPLPWCYLRFDALRNRYPERNWPDQMALFLHERSSPGGNRRLVVFHGSLDRSLSLPDSGDGQMPVWSIPLPRVYLIDPATLRGQPQVVSEQGIGFEEWGVDGLAESAVFRIYPGQPDPHDASHFTIRFEADDKSGMIEGWLQDDDTVKFMVTGAPPWAYRFDASTGE